MSQQVSSEVPSGASPRLTPSQIESIKGPLIQAYDDLCHARAAIEEEVQLRAEVVESFSEYVTGEKQSEDWPEDGISTDSVLVDWRRSTLMAAAWLKEGAEEEFRHEIARLKIEAESDPPFAHKPEVGPVERCDIERGHVEKVFAVLVALDGELHFLPQRAAAKAGDDNQAEAITGDGGNGDDTAPTAVEQQAMEADGQGDNGKSKGGRNRKWNDLEAMILKADEEDPKPSDQKIANDYCRKYGTRPDKPTAKTVKDVRYRMKQRSNRT